MSLQYEKDLEEAPAPEEQRESVQRAETIFPLYSTILIACLAAVSLAQFYVDGQAGILFGGEKSIMAAGFVKPLFLRGQYWRILTGAALHGGIIHLAFNCYALYVLGRIIEILSNRAHLAIIFLLSAIGGGILSLIFLPDAVSVGASGGIVGFLGYLTVYGYKRRKLLTNAFLKNMLLNIGFIAFFGIVVVPNIDNFGHLGGLIIGAIYGFVQIPSDLHKDPRQTSFIIKILGIVSLGIFILTCLFSIILMLSAA